MEHRLYCGTTAPWKAVDQVAYDLGFGHRLVSLMPRWEEWYHPDGVSLRVYAYGVVRIGLSDPLAGLEGLATKFWLSYDSSASPSLAEAEKRMAAGLLSERFAREEKLLGGVIERWVDESWNEYGAQWRVIEGFIDGLKRYGATTYIRNAPDRDPVVFTPASPGRGAGRGNR